VSGRGVVVRNNHVVDTGGSTAGYVNAYGIMVQGPGAKVMGNNIFETAESGSGASSIGVRVYSGAGSVVEDNRIGNEVMGSGTSTGVEVNSSSDVVVVNNRITKMTVGVNYAGGSTGSYRDNILRGVATPYIGGTEIARGTITGVTASTGLEGGATSGEATLSVATGYRLPQTCTGGQIASWNGSTWVCAADSVGNPSVSVATLDGISSAGAALEYSKGDHRHGLGPGSVSDANIASVSGSKVSGTVPSASNADTLDGQHGIYYLSLGNHTGTLGVSQGGTGSSSQNFVDLSSSQTVGGAKTFSSPVISTVGTGTAPLQVASVSIVPNLNAEMVGGNKLGDLDGRYGQTSPVQNPRSNALTTVDSGGYVGRYTSITIGTDGLPVISYYDETNTHLKVAHCGNPACSSGNTLATIDSGGGVGRFTSITIGIDGLPIISYYATPSLKVAHCGNASCSSGNTTTTVDSGGTVGQYTSITIGRDGLPVISYYDATNYDLKVAHCGNASCSSGNTITTVDSGGAVGQYTSIAIGTDGLPVISYYDWGNYDLKVAHCGNASCSSGNTITTIDSYGGVGSDTSITIGRDGLPVISYYDSAQVNQDLKVAHCGNASCSSGNTITTVDSGGNVGQYSSITVGTDGLPIISYYDNTNTYLKMAKCGNPACSSGNTTIIIDSGWTVGWYTSITIGTDSLPVISYYDNTNQDLKVAKCANPFCLNNWSRR
jgi:hypothetical protein